MRLRRSWWRSGVTVAVGLIISVWGNVDLPWPSWIAVPGLPQSTVTNRVLAETAQHDLPLQAHPLPPTLAQWHDSQSRGDYFDQIQPVNVGYLVWSEFPIKVFVQPIEANPANPAIAQRSQAWVEAVAQAIKEWNLYLPLVLVEQAEAADIQIWRVTPPLRLEPPSPAGSQPTDQRPPRLQIRARNAETRYEIYVKQTVAQGNKPATIALAPRFTIYLRPDQPLAYTLATARHELGHALGLWGHSLQPTDALYAMPVRQPPPISDRDVNTLKRVYEQPTRLGWPISR